MSIIKYIIALIILLVLLGLVYPFMKPTTPPAVPGNPDGEQVFCTMDAMMCPDGTYVGRTGPSCAFVCPSPGESEPGGPAGGTSLYEEFTVGLNEPKIIGETTITAWAVTEDSRCPSDFDCIQAGRAVVALRLATPSGSSIMEIEVGKTVTTETLAITLDEVSPYPTSSKKTQDGEYRFKFNVKGR